MNIQSSSEKNSKQILIIDDDIVFSNSIADILKDSGYRLAKANSENEALKIIQKFKAQLALIDIRLGEKNAINLIQKLKTHQPELYCIMITAYISSEIAVESLKQGACDYITKSVNVNDLLATLERFYEKLQLKKDKDTAVEALTESEKKYSLLMEKTKRMEAEAALQKWTSIFENAEWGIVTCGIDNRIIDIMNPAFAKMHGYTTKELIGKSISFLSVHECQAEILYHFSVALKKGRHIFESAHVHKNGFVFPVRIDVTAVKDSDENSKYLVVNIQNITERNLSEKVMHLQSQALEQAIDGIIVLNMDGYIQFANKSWSLMHGYELQEIMGDHVSIFHTGKQLKNETMSHINQIIKNGGNEGEILHVKKDGSIFPTHMSTTIFNNKNGDPIGMIGIARDITDQKLEKEELNSYRFHLEELVEKRTNELKSSKEKAESANRAKSEFLANMSHELRTPLNSIIGFSKLMKMGYEEGEYEKNLTNIISSGEHLLLLIEDILDMTRVETGKLNFDMQLLSIHNIVSSSIQFIMPQAEQKEIKIEYNTACEDTIVYGVEQWIYQIFINLLTNAIKFSDNKSAIVINISEHKGTLKAEVTDNGIGISRENLEHIFEKFYQVNSYGINYKNEGTGLGLAIIKKLVEIMSYEITVSSEIGKGSTFTLLLPVIRQMSLNKSKNIDNNKKVKMTELNEQYILVVDDQVENRDLLAAFFKKSGQQYITAESGEESLEIIGSKNGITIILMDVKMNGMSGIDAMKQIKKKYDVPIIAVTAFAMEGDKNKLLDKGFDDYISKPIEFDVLEKKMKSLLNK